MLKIQSGKTAQIRVKPLSTVTLEITSGTAVGMLDGEQVITASSGTSTFGPFLKVGVLSLTANGGVVSYKVGTKRNSVLPAFVKDSLIYSADGALVGGPSGPVSGGYTLPPTGIPRGDLSLAVLDSLTRADNAIPSSQKGAANGVATLDAQGRIPAAQNGAATFVYDAQLQAAKATVGGQEVLALLRSGTGFKGRVVPDSNTLVNLLAARQTAGVIAYPTDASGIVVYNGTGPGDYPTYESFGAFLTINLNTSPLVYLDPEFGSLTVRMPRGVRRFALTAPNGVPAGFVGTIVMVKDSVEPLAEYTVVFMMDVAAEYAAGRLSAIGTADVAQTNGGIFGLESPTDSEARRDYFRFLLNGVTGITTLVEATQLNLVS